MYDNDVDVAAYRDEENPACALYRRARVEPERTAFVAGPDVWTYRRLAHGSAQLARAMRARGVAPGDRVALHMSNLPELAVAYYACFHTGAIAAPLNTRFKTPELRLLLRRLRPALYLGHAPLYPLVASVETDVLDAGARFVIGDDASPDGMAQPWARLLAAPGEPAMPPCRFDPDAPAVLLTTSGTTGQPKLVVHTPATLAAICASLAYQGLGREQTALVSLPMVHGAGLMLFLSCIHFGARMVLLQRFDPDLTLDAIEAHRCSWVVGLPFMWAEMVARQRERPRKIDTLQHCTSTGDVSPAALQRDVIAMTGGVALGSVLAQSEAAWSFISSLEPSPVSRVAPGVEVRVVDEMGAAVAPGEIGELLVRSASVSPGYWAGPGRIEGGPEDGWWRTGDLVRETAGNELWYMARKKELIVRGGSNIAPAEVEQTLLTHPCVCDAVAFGVPDPVLGQRVAALVQLRHAGGANDNVILDRIRADAAARLADYKVPEQLHAVDAIPRNALGKLDRMAALAMLPRSAI